MTNRAISLPIFINSAIWSIYTGGDNMNQEDLGTMRIPKLLRTMALPLIIAQIVNGMYNLVDRVFLGHIAESGAETLTGVGLTYSVILIISAFSSLIGNGGAPRAATCMGQGNRKRAEQILSTSAISLLILSFALMAFFYMFKVPLLYLFGASDRTIVYGNEYLTIYLLGTPFVLLTLGLNPFISMQGNTMLSMMTVVIGAVLNIVLDPVFIFLFDMGAGGAAAATVISQGASALYVILFLTGRKSSLHLSFSPRSFTQSALRPILSLGLSPFTMGITEAAISFVFTSRLQSISGDMAVGAMTILSSILNFAMMPVNGMNQALVPIISYNFGAGRKDRVLQAFRAALAIALIYTAAVSLLCNIFPRAFISIFTSSSALVDFTVPMMKFYITGFMIFGFQTASQNTFVGLGQAGISLFFACFRKVILLIPLVYILSSTVLGAEGVFLAESIADSVSAISAFTAFMLTRNRILDKGAVRT